MFASRYGKKFDADIKKWRFMSILVLNWAFWIEITALLKPQWFLLIASLANVGKNEELRRTRGRYNLSQQAAAGQEAARHNVQINLIAQHFVENPEYFSEEFQQSDAFKKLIAEVPAGRLARPEEDAALAIFLASNESDFFVGQAIPFSGGWAQ